MNLLDKISTGITSTIDIIVEKNRQLAQLNRLAAIIRNEKAVLEHAYAALGKQYYKILEKNAEKSDTEQICEVIKFSEARLKKAQARYDYIKIFGMPTNSSGDVEMIHSVDSDYGNSEASDEEVSEEETGDITIAVADEAENAETAGDVTSEDNSDDGEPAHNKKQSRKKTSAPVDDEAADDNTEI